MNLWSQGQRKFEKIISGLGYDIQGKYHKGNSYTFTISRETIISIRSDHEVVKMDIIRLLAEDGFKIMSTVFDPTRGENGAEKHMLYKELPQPTHQSGTDEASVNN